MIHKFQNFAWKKDGWRVRTMGVKETVPVQDWDTLVDCNLSQLLPGTLVGGKLKGIKLINCNCCNVKVPKDWPKPKGCLQIQQSFCSHENPDLVKLGLPKCEKLCEHVREYIPAVEIDGQKVGEELIVRDSRALKSSVRISDGVKMTYDKDGAATSEKAVD